MNVCDRLSIHFPICSWVVCSLSLSTHKAHIYASTNGSRLISVRYLRSKNLSLFPHYNVFLSILFIVTLSQRTAVCSVWVLLQCMLPSCISSVLLFTFLRHCVKFTLSLRTCIHRLSFLILDLLHSSFFGLPLGSFSGIKDRWSLMQLVNYIH